MEVLALSLYSVSFLNHDIYHFSLVESKSNAGPHRIILNKDVERRF